MFRLTLRPGFQPGCGHALCCWWHTLYSRCLSAPNKSIGCRALIWGSEYASGKPVFIETWEYRISVFQEEGKICFWSKFTVRNRDYSEALVRGILLAQVRVKAQKYAHFQMTVPFSHKYQESRR